MLLCLLQLRDHFFAYADTADGTAYTYSTFGSVFLERYVSSGSPLVGRILELLDVDKRCVRGTIAAVTVWILMDDRADVVQREDCVARDGVSGVLGDAAAAG